VGSYPEGASPAGVFDLSGSVVEWTASDAVLYPGSGMPENDGPKPGEKVFRGGSYKRPENEATSTWRNWAPPTGSGSGYEDFGFRCVLDAP
jgi:iron(II)-dependent oxidoreductase